MQVILAGRAGFCSGVRRAVNSLLAQADQYGPGSTLGPLVHNDQVVEYLEKRFVTAIDEPGQNKGSYLAIRTHGVAPDLFKKLEALAETTIIDLTCPRVHKVQRIAATLKNEEYSVYIFGDPGHPEVIGLTGWAGEGSVVVSSAEELAKMTIQAPAALVAQTTADPESYEKAKEIFLQKEPGGKVFQTLCPETRLRQEEAADMAKRVEALVVVGNESSANTQALFHSCRRLKPTCRINHARELDQNFIRHYRVIGVTAGASTPPWTIKEVVERMENEHLESKNEEQFEFDGEVKVAQVGEQVWGKVARVAGEEVFIDIGSKTEAILPQQEVHLEEGKTLADIFSPEDDIEVTVLETDEQEGKVIVSHKRLARDKRLQELEKALDEDIILEGRVKQVVAAGLVIDLGSGTEGFMPGSLVDIRYVPDFKEFQEQQVTFKIIEFDRQKGKLILSRKKVLEEESALQKEQIINSLEIGSTVSGTVKRLTGFGAFVDIGGIDGLVHISELSWERVNHPGEVLKTGEEVEVKVLEVIPEKERISLSIRKTQPDPWTRAVEDIDTGQLMMGKVTRLVNFGAFIEIKPGVEGLAHISQLAEYHVNHPSEILREGEEVEVKILEVKPKAKRISLSLKDARGVMVAHNNVSESGAENGNVTLGDVFGDLFDQEESAEEGEKANLQADGEREEEVNEIDHEGEQGDRD